MPETQLEQAPDGVALLLVDIVGPFDFDGAEDLIPAAKKAAEPIRRLLEEARGRGTPVIYVNDNHGQWLTDRDRLIGEHAREGSPGYEVMKDILPGEHDYFLIKPQVSGFYATNLPVLLPRLGVSRLVLVGWAADICILFTAADAHMREYDLWAPADALACESDDRAGWALEIMRKSMQAETRPTTELSLDAWAKASPSEAGEA